MTDPLVAALQRVDEAALGDSNDEHIDALTSALDLAVDIIKRGTPPVTSTVIVPAQIHATYDGERIERISVTPLASDAGYFGQKAMVWDGDHDLDVDDPRSPFWGAVSAYLNEHGNTIPWEE